MRKDIRQKVYEKYNELCAYTGTQLEKDWQVDHMTSKFLHVNNAYYIYGNLNEIHDHIKKIDDIENLLPAQKIINHYKRAMDLEQFREYMLNFHKRLAKLPKNTKILKTQKRKEYMNKIALLFDITPDKPFSGKFYFERI
jgi:hypothetical protein